MSTIVENSISLRNSIVAVAKNEDIVLQGDTPLIRTTNYLFKRRKMIAKQYMLSTSDNEKHELLEIFKIINNDIKFIIGL